MTSRLGRYTGHVDPFTRDHLPPLEQWPELRFDLPELRYPPRLNAGRVLLDDACAEGHGPRTAVLSDLATWTYAELKDHADRIAHVLTRDLGVVPGNRVLLRAPNSPMLVAAWLACLRAGAVAVTTMPLLRAKELTQIALKAQVDHCLCDARLSQELDQAAAATGRLGRTLHWNDGELEARMARYPAPFMPVDTAVDDVALLAFTSGTTGIPKATMHFHRDVLAMADVVGRHLLATSPDDIYAGSPPLGFTFGLGALLVFPLRFRAAAALIEQPSPDALLAAVERFGATALFTAPTMYRHLLPRLPGRNIASLRRVVSAGEPLPKATSDAWYAATGERIIDGIGATEMIHIFISAAGEAIRPGATGKPLPGYQACVLGDDGRPLLPGSVGRLAVKGPTGCRYLDDERQRDYVADGWNVTGDRYLHDAEGYFWFQSRTDDMILSAGYNIAAAEVENALAAHPSVLECAVIGVPDEDRGQVVKACVVPNAGFTAGAALGAELQEFVKRSIAPYKYPRIVEFLTALPKTQTGKIQRFELRRRALERGAADAGGGGSGPPGGTLPGKILDK